MTQFITDWHWKFDTVGEYQNELRNELEITTEQASRIETTEQERELRISLGRQGKLYTPAWQQRMFSAAERYTKSRRLWLRFSNHDFESEIESAAGLALALAMHRGYATKMEINQAIYDTFKPCYRIYSEPWLNRWGVYPMNDNIKPEFHDETPKSPR